MFGNKLFTTHERISQKVKGVLMQNLQRNIFIWRRRYWQIFKSALVYLKSTIRKILNKSSLRVSYMIQLLTKIGEILNISQQSSWSDNETGVPSIFKYEKKDKRASTQERHQKTLFDVNLLPLSKAYLKICQTSVLKVSAEKVNGF